MDEGEKAWPINNSVHIYFTFLVLSNSVNFKSIPHFAANIYGRPAIQGSNMHMIYAAAKWAYRNVQQTNTSSGAAAVFQRNYVLVQGTKLQSLSNLTICNLFQYASSEQWSRFKHTFISYPLKMYWARQIKWENVLPYIQYTCWQIQTIFQLKIKKERV